MQARVARGVTWTLADQWGRQAVNLAVFVVLARLIEPQAFGLVSLAAVFIALAQVFLDQGLGDALIQRERVEKEHADTAFWAALAMGLLLTAAGVVLAGPLSTILNEPALAPVLQAMSLTFVLSALSSTQAALLRRELRFRSLALRSLVAGVGGGVVGVAMAIAGFGVWSLVGQALATGAFSVLVLWTVSPWRPGLQVSRATFRELFGFGANVVGIDLLNFLSRRSDNLLVGAFLGTTLLGFYAVGYQLFAIGNQLLLGVAGKVAFPAFSRLQADRPRTLAAYYRVTRISNLLVLPGSVGLALVAPELILTLFGARWAESIPVASLLFLTGVVYSVVYFNGALLKGLGHANVVLRIRLASAVLNVIGFVVAVRFGIVAVAAAFVIRGYLVLPLNLYAARRHAGVGVREYLVQFVPAAAGTFAMAAAVVALKLAAAPVLPTPLLLVAEAALGAAVYAVTIALVAPTLFREGLEVVRLVLPLPGRPRPPAGRRPGRRPAGEGGAARRRLLERPEAEALSEEL